jgi:hypothetical protein
VQIESKNAAAIATTKNWSTQISNSPKTCKELHVLHAEMMSTTKLVSLLPFLKKGESCEILGEPSYLECCQKAALALSDKRFGWDAAFLCTHNTSNIMTVAPEGGGCLLWI